MARKKEIVIRIPADGNNVSVDQIGMVGKECSENVSELISKLGRVTSANKKPEYYKRKKDVHIDVQK